MAPSQCKMVRRAKITAKNSVEFLHHHYSHSLKTEPSATATLCVTWTQPLAPSTVSGEAIESYGAHAGEMLQTGRGDI